MPQSAYPVGCDINFTHDFTKKGSPKFRFYTLYDKVFRADVLWMAHRRCQINGGAAGVDGQRFDAMRRFILGWKTLGHQHRLGARIVNYADDFVICCRGTADEAMHVMRNMMNQFKLTVNETKTKLCKVPDESFDFLGYTLGRHYSPKTGRAYIGTRPSKKKVQRLCREISEMTSR